MVHCRRLAPALLTGTSGATSARVTACASRARAIAAADRGAHGFEGLRVYRGENSKLEISLQRDL